MDAIWDFTYKWTKKARRFKQLRSPQARSKSLWVNFTVANFVESSFSDASPIALPPLISSQLVAFQTNKKFVLMTSSDIKSTPYCTVSAINFRLRSTSRTVVTFWLSHLVWIITLFANFAHLLVTKHGSDNNSATNNFRPCLKSVFLANIQMKYTMSAVKSLSQIYVEHSPFRIRHLTTSPIQSPTCFKYRNNGCLVMGEVPWFPFHHRHTN